MHGGGFGAATYVKGDVTVNIGSVIPPIQPSTIPTYSGTATIYGDVYGGGALGHVNAFIDESTLTFSTNKKTAINLNSGKIYGDVYGGGLGQKGTGDANIPAYVGGDVEVTQHEVAFYTGYEATDADPNPVTGRIFGCNNINGTPKGNVTVEVLSTQRLDGDVHKKEEYEIQSVYGGGNQADYVPNSDKKTVVKIHGCEDTSIQNVYGGGNSAKVPATDVNIYGAFEIESVFGGGNGSERVKQGDTWTDSPGADVTGAAKVTPKGGNIHNVYAGSNTKGNCYGGTTIEYTDLEGKECDLKVLNFYGGGRSADQDGDVTIDLSACELRDGVQNVYAGSYSAKIKGKVTLTIKSGVFTNVFGGNDQGGNIGGPIVVNIEETEDENCKPIIISNLYGGGNKADYPGSGAKTNTGDDYTEGSITLNVKSFTRIDNIYGGSLEAEVKGNTYVNINTTKGTWAGKNFNLSAYTDYEGEKIIPNINNGKIDDAIGTIGNVYGGGKKGVVTGNTKIDIGTQTQVEMVSLPKENDEYQKKDVLGVNITGNVFGGGDMADVTGNTEVNICAIQGDAILDGNSQSTGEYNYSSPNYAGIEGFEGIKIGGSVYGGGKLGSVGTYTVNTNTDDGILDGKPETCTDGGTSRVTILGNAEIGPDDMVMPTFTGHVFGASKGSVLWDEYKDIYNGSSSLSDQQKLDELAKIAYVDYTYVTIGGNAFVKGSVYGGSENGHVLHDTHVRIEGKSQIGAGHDGTNSLPKYAENAFFNPADKTDAEINAGALKETASWVYGNNNVYSPYDENADESGKYPEGSAITDAAGGRPTGTDGHTYYGNVFGGGSGKDPYAPGQWLETAGWVEGNTYVNITGGHILTSIYGGNELTNVGKEQDVETKASGTCTVNFGGTATLGVPRTLTQIAAHPVTCYLFGAGKGDQRVLFNQGTNVNNVVVNVTGSIIYGSVFGGGEDGHVLGDVTLTISDNAHIGTWGTSYVDGNVFGGGRGFAGDALTAGVVSGNVKMTISGGTMLGSIYGGGRLGSVGTYLAPATDNGVNGHYGKLIEDGYKQVINHSAGTVTAQTSANAKHGYIDITISGGTIGNTHEYIIPSATDVPGITETDVTKWTITEGGDWDKWKSYYNIPNTEFEYDSDLKLYRLSHTKGGNVFAGSMGRLYLLNDDPIPNWPELGKVKSTKLTINGSAKIYSNVYGGGEFGKIEGNDENGYGTNITINLGDDLGDDLGDGGCIGKVIGNDTYTYGSVFGGGYGSSVEILETNVSTNTDTEDESQRPKLVSAIVDHDTKVTMQAGKILASVYGGGEVASVKGNTYVTVSGGTIGKNKTNDTYYGGFSMGNVYGGGKGTKGSVRTGRILGNTNVTISETSPNSTTIYHNVYGGGAFATVGDFDYVKDQNTFKVIGINGRKQNTNGGKANIYITGGTIGVDGKENGMVFGSSRGDVGDIGAQDDLLAWVYDAAVIIGDTTDNATGSTATPIIKGSVYGGGENGHNYHDAYVHINGGTIGIEIGETITEDDIEYNGAAYPFRGNVYGSGCGTDKYDYDSNNDGVNDASAYNPKAGIVLNNTNVNITGGHVVRNVYGGGAMGSVGTIDSYTLHRDYKQEQYYIDGQLKGSYDGAFYSYGLSWPAELEYPTTGNDSHTYTGKATVTITGGQIGVDGANGDGYVYGAARGEAGDRYEMALLANVRETEVNIGTQNSENGPDIKGSVFGGSANGHVYEDANVNIYSGTINKSVY
ncbi:MAG: hypothetical protein IKO33_01830, partial [Bacteroidaceae bacterium]|nr:hypothetical protein [Bacteroidaceae bacterium]